MHNSMSHIEWILRSSEITMKTGRFIKMNGLDLRAAGY